MSEMHDRMRTLRTEMEDALRRMTNYAEQWFEAFTGNPERVARLDELHTDALRDYRRAERKLRKLVGRHA